jgi:hypothetical protein
MHKISYARHRFPPEIITMTAFSTKQILQPQRIYVRFQGQSGHNGSKRETSADDPKLTYMAEKIGQNRRGR